MCRCVCANLDESAVGVPGKRCLGGRVGKQQNRTGAQQQCFVTHRIVNAIHPILRVQLADEFSDRAEAWTSWQRWARRKQKQSEACAQVTRKTMDRGQAGRRRTESERRETTTTAMEQATRECKSVKRQPATEDKIPNIPASYVQLVFVLGSVGAYATSGRFEPQGIDQDQPKLWVLKCINVVQLQCCGCGHTHRRKFHDYGLRFALRPPCVRPIMFGERVSGRLCLV
jgi:hypothetical protein